MKTYYKLFILFLSVFCGISCSDDDDKGRADLTLDIEAVSSFFRNDTIILDANQLQAEALTINWEKATDLGVDFSIDYIFRLDIGYNDFASSTDPEIINDEFKKAIQQKS
ncbi:MAG: hypothetical protein LUH15_05470 [Tannerellaceae bacterium]|nr:hypothetical protein [Tannerellaceae bacterium]